MINIQNRLIRCIAVLICVMLLIPVGFELEVNAAKDRPIIVSMGDSYSSGEGIEEFYGQNASVDEKVKNDDWLAHRSTQSWPGQLELDGVKMSKHRYEAQKDNFDEANWFFVASSGALTSDITGYQQKDYNIKINGGEYKRGSKSLSPQIKIIDEIGGENIDYVTITIGGNDANFKKIVELAAYPTSSFAELQQELKRVWERFYAPGGIKDSIYDTYKAINSRVGDDTVIIVAGYPTLFDEAKGKGVLISQKEAKEINDSVRQFNREIEALVERCKAEGLKITYVSVEDKFKGREASTKDALINRIYAKSKAEDLDSDAPSAYSVHPNKDGAKVYAELIQDKIDSIEKDGGKSEWNSAATTSDERDIVLVLDNSGSMSGKPMEETKEAAIKFYDTVLEGDASIGTVTYDDTAELISDFSMDKNRLTYATQAISTGGSTNIEAGMLQAEKMLDKSSAKKKIMVLMSDGEPNAGKVGQDLIDYADKLKSEGMYIYTLGFFTSLSDRSDAQKLMEEIASPGCHFEIENAEDIVYFFDTIGQVVMGGKYTYIRIACPVDVTVEYNGEVLSSDLNDTNTITKFGSLTFEENDEEEHEEHEDINNKDMLSDDNTDSESSELSGTVFGNKGKGSDDAGGYINKKPESEAEPDNNAPIDNRVKILRLKEGVDYDIKINGTGTGHMDYTISFMDENGDYTDVRKFEDIEITNKTVVDTVAANKKKTRLNVDTNGDGNYDKIYEAGRNGTGKLAGNNSDIYIIIIFAVILIGVAVVFVVRRKRKKNKDIVA